MKGLTEYLAIFKFSCCDALCPLLFNPSLHIKKEKHEPRPGSILCTAPVLKKIWVSAKQYGTNANQVWRCKVIDLIEEQLND